MITLAIETSCDETAICLLETRTSAGAAEYRILANLIHSQVDLHKHYGGVFPIMAKREHARNIMPLLEAAFVQANMAMRKEKEIKSPPADAADNAQKFKIAEIKKILQEKESDLLEHLLASPLVEGKPAAIDRIAVTRGPGLEPALWVGVNLARALGILWEIPVIGVNHMEGHIVGSLLPSSEIAPDFKKLIPIAYPALALLISGGHTELVLVKDGRKYEIIGRTKDDAVGEAFDKVARMLGLPYPGGPEISRLAEEDRKENGGNASNDRKIVLPRPMIHSRDLDFSFSGLKTAVVYAIREIGKNKKTDDGKGLTDGEKKEIAREFEDAVADVLASKTEKAIEARGAETLVAGGGVVANGHIGKTLRQLAERRSVPILFPPAGVSGDNALMIALAGTLSENTGTAIEADGNLSL